MAEAATDLRAAFRWYEARREGSGREFLDQVDKALAGVRKRPLGRPPQYRGTRRVFLQRFPCFVMYFSREEDDKVLVLAVLRHKRHQKLARARVRGAKAIRQPRTKR